MPTVVDYASLKQAILDFSHRSDLTSYVDYFIQDAQSEINDDILDQNLGNGIRAMESAFTGTITAGTIGVPGDWLAPKGLQLVISTNIQPLSFVQAEALYQMYPNRGANGIPAYVARDGNTLVFGPSPDSGYNVIGTYYAAAPLLSVSQTTNWMVLQAPMMLLAACLVKAAKFLKDSDGLQMWGGEYAEKLSALIQRDKAEKYSSGTLAVQAV